MRVGIILAVTLVILAVQFHLGVRKRKFAGAVMPGIMAVLLLTAGFLEKRTEYIGTGIVSAAALWIVWAIGYFKSAKYEKTELERMKAKDLT